MPPVASLCLGNDGVSPSLEAAERHTNVAGATERTDVDPHEPRRCPAAVPSKGTAAGHFGAAGGAPGGAAGRAVGGVR